MINKAIPQLFNNPKTIFMTVSARDILFDGVLINCTRSKDFAVNTVCDQLRAKPSGLEKLDDDYFKFSIFGVVSESLVNRRQKIITITLKSNRSQKNNTPDENKITVKRGMKDIKEVGQVVLYNDKPEMDYWSGPYCNQIKGTDTTIFPPFMDTSDVWSFGAEVCRYTELQTR